MLGVECRRCVVRDLLRCGETGALAAAKAEPNNEAENGTDNDTRTGRDAADGGGGKTRARMVGGARREG